MLPLGFGPASFSVQPLDPASGRFDAGKLPFSLFELPRVDTTARAVVLNCTKQDGDVELSVQLDENAISDGATCSHLVTRTSTLTKVL